MLALSPNAWSDIKYWVIASQTCNIHNHSLEVVREVELVGATQIAECEASKIKGDDPRILHVESSGPNENLLLRIDIQCRLWLPRSRLANLEIPKFRVIDNSNIQWLDVFAGWLGRSYTRIALPDDFNHAMRASKIEDVFLKKVVKNKDDLYGIYFALTHEQENGEEWQGVLGEMPSPYDLSIILVTYEHADPLKLKERLVKQLFIDEIEDPDDRSKKITRSALAKRKNIRIIKDAIDAKSESEITLKELKSLVRYSLVDYLSTSGVVVT